MIGAAPAGDSVIDAVLELPFKLALTVAVWPLVTLAAVAVKLAALAPAATITEDGTVKLALLLLNATLAPPLGAAPLKLTVQLVLPGVVSADAWHVNALTTVVEPTVTWPPEALVAIAAPEEEAATALLIPTLIELLPTGVRVMVATIPFPMPAVFSPLPTHIAEPEAGAHCSVFCAAVRADPAVIEKPDTDDAG